MRIPCRSITPKASLIRKQSRCSNSLVAEHRISVLHQPINGFDRGEQVSDKCGAWHKSSSRCLFDQGDDSEPGQKGTTIKVGQLEKLKVGKYDCP
jgi:hypothetical protein